jgi:ArsR family transcriptional regulator, arsenate/arsenite/antimonite-responsive transcriptional repressor
VSKIRAKTITPEGNDGLCCSSVVDAPLSENEATELAHVLGALADPVRLRLLSLVASQVEICSCDLEAPLGKSQPTVSHHTKVLADAGLLVGDKRGRWMWWRVEPTRLASVRAALGG